MDSARKNARVAGFIYLSLVVTAPFSLILVPRTLIVLAAARAAAVAASQAAPSDVRER